MPTIIATTLLTFIAGSVVAMLLERYTLGPYLDRQHMRRCHKQFCVSYHHALPDPTPAPEPAPTPTCTHPRKIHLRDDDGPDTIECLDCGANLDLKRRTTR